MDNKVISADGHLDLFFLPPDTFTTRTSSRLKDKVPRVVDLDRIPTWVGDGKVMGTYRGWMGRGGLTGYRGERMMEAGWDPTHPADPKLRVKDLDIDGVAAEVIYGIRFIEDSIKDPEVVTATYRAYNDFIVEFCAHSPHRLIGVADIPAHSVQVAVDEIRRIGKGGLGLRGALFDWFNAPKPIWHPMWEPLWSAAEEADVVISFHIGAGHGTTTVGPSGVDEKLSGTIPKVSMLAHQAVVAMQADECLASIILCGALERHPNLKIVLAECHIGWIPYLLDRLDAKYKEGHYKDVIKTVPSELFRHQMWATFQDDKVGARLAEDYAPNNFCWASDYPHLDSVWPDSQAFIRETMNHLSATMQEKLTYGNVAALYKL